MCKFIDSYRERQSFRLTVHMYATIYLLKQILVLTCRGLAGQAAERARIMEDYLQRRQAAAANKARGQADLYGVRKAA